MSCKELQPLLTKGVGQANVPKPRHSGTRVRACVRVCVCVHVRGPIRNRKPRREETQWNILT